MTLQGFRVSVQPAPQHIDEAFGFRVSVHTPPSALVGFAVSVTVQQPLQGFQVHVRSLPDTQTPFAGSIQRPVGRVEN